MSSAPEYDSDEEPITEDGGGDGEEEVILRPEDQQPQPQPRPAVGYNNPTITRLLRNPRVLEVHIRHKIRGNGRIREPYVCIIFVDGSSIERPLRDVEENEEPICPSMNDIEPVQNRVIRREGGGERRQSRWNRMNPFSWIMNNRNGSVKRLTSESIRREGNCIVVRRKSVATYCENQGRHVDYDPNCPACKRHRKSNHGRVNMYNRGNDCWSTTYED